jgi:hypothetical protein
MKIEKEKELVIKHKRINIIEGSYSQHPYFGEPYLLKIFCDIDSDNQLINISSRIGNDPEMLSKFKELWIPKENEYFEKNETAENSDVYIDWND